MIVKKRVIWYGFSFIVLVLTSITMLLVSRGFYYDFETNSIKKNGAVYVRSIPRESNIYIENELKKKKTPISISLPEAAYLLRVEKEGYLPFSKTISIKEGYVSWENFVFLVLEERPEQELTNNGIKDYLVSPKKNTIAYQDLKDDIWFIDIATNEHKKVSTGKKEPQILEWNNKNNSILLKDNNYYYIVSEEKETKIQKIPGNIKKVEMSNDNNTEVFAISENYLYSANEDKILIKEHGITAFSQTEKSIFYTKKASSNYELWKSSFDFKTKDKIVTENKNINSIFPSNKDRYAYTTEDKTLHLYENSESKKLYDNVSFGKWSEEDKKLLYGTEQELRVYVAESNNPFQIKNKVITRLSSPINNSIWFYDYNHIIYKNNDNIIFVGTDGTNAVTLKEKSNSDINKFDITKYGRSLIYTETNGKTTNIKIMKIGEENGLIPY